MIGLSASASRPVVRSPSAQPPHHLAVSAVTAAPRSGGGLSGRDHTLASTTVIRPAMGDSLTRKECADDLDALGKPLVALSLVGPIAAGDRFIDRLAAPERNPRPPRIHFTDRRDRLSEDRGVISVTGCGDDPDGKAGRLERRAEPRPCKTRLTLLLAPGMKVIGRFCASKPCRFGKLHVSKELTWRELLVARVIAYYGSYAKPSRTRQRRSRARGGGRSPCWFHSPVDTGRPHTEQAMSTGADRSG